jgi:methionine synthase I (cobalamin-dependent)/5,10-methylenetetrahydrofolate reductase
VGRPRWRGSRRRPILAAMPTSRDRFRARLAARPLLADGGMGTLMFSRGIPQRACLDELVVSRPEMVAAAHREYLEAGAELIETLTFGANRHRLEAYGLAGEAGRLNRRAAQLAREARDVAAKDALVGGSIGPLGAPTRELAGHDAAATRTTFREQIDGLLEGGVDLLVIETFFDLEQALIALDEARRASDLPIVVEMTFGEELAALDGTTPETAARVLAEAGADVVGVNCGVGPVACLEAVGRMARHGADVAGLSVMPNAGLPQRIDGRFVYAAGPEYFAQIVGPMRDAGAALIGGCCGTTPAHVAAMRASLDALLLGGGAPGVVPAADGMRVPDAPRTPRFVAIEALDAADSPSPTRLASALAAGQYVVSVEIDPPRSIRIDRTIAAARLLQSAGVDTVNVSDSAMARVRMGAFAVAFGIQHDLDLECMVHLTTRDRNLMALESELLGAHALGVRNIIALTGDPPRIGDYPTGTGVWDVDSVGLIEILARLNRGEDQAGSPIGQSASFTIACGFDPAAEDRAAEWSRLERKLEAGAHLVMTQPLYSLDQVETMLDGARDRFGNAGLPVPVLLGILPLHSGRHAEFLHNEVPGITIPDETRAALREAGDRGAEVGLERAGRLLDGVGDAVAGTYVMPSFGRYEQAAELVRRIRARRPAAAAAEG